MVLGSNAQRALADAARRKAKKKTKLDLRAKLGDYDDDEVGWIKAKDFNACLKLLKFELGGDALETLTTGFASVQAGGKQVEHQCPQACLSTPHPPPLLTPFPPSHDPSGRRQRASRAAWTTAHSRRP